MLLCVTKDPIHCYISAFLGHMPPSATCTPLLSIITVTYSGTGAVIFWHVSNKTPIATHVMWACLSNPVTADVTHVGCMWWGHVVPFWCLIGVGGFVRVCSHATANKIDATCQIFQSWWCDVMNMIQWWKLFCHHHPSVTLSFHFFLFTTHQSD